MTGTLSQDGKFNLDLLSLPYSLGYATSWIEAYRQETNLRLFETKLQTTYRTNAHLSILLTEIPTITKFGCVSATD